MALTAKQKADARRWAGYPSMGDMPDSDTYDFSMSQISPVTSQTLYRRLNTLRTEEEEILVTTYLTPLASLETDILGAADNLDTDEASVWKHNKKEVGDRTALFDQWRRNMCHFLGICPGPALGDGLTWTIRG